MSASIQKNVKTSVQFKKEISNKKIKKDTTKQSYVTKFIKPVLVCITVDDNSLHMLELRDKFILLANNKQKI